MNISALGVDVLAGDVEPELFVGRRVSGSIAVAHVPLGRDAASAVQDIVANFLDAAILQSPRPYEQAAALEAGEEYFTFPLDDLRATADVHRGGNLSVESDDDTAEHRGVALLDAFDHLDEAEPFNPAAMNSILFYVIRLESAGKSVLLLRKLDPTLAMRKVGVALLLGQMLEVTSKPDFVLANTFDLIFAEGYAFIWSKSAFEQLVSDVRVDLLDVESRAADVVAALASSIPLVGDSSAALVAACSLRLSMARRLASLPERLASLALTAAAVREALERHGEDPSLLLDGDMFDFGVERVPAFLDVVEGRWFEDDFTGEKRRADRLSRR